MARGRWNDRWTPFPVTEPIKVSGGLTTRSQRGAIVNTWWSKRFIEVLESYGLGSRLQRGRRYARAGQVLSLEVTSGNLSAQVQGSRRTPYQVSLETTPPTQQQWERIDQVLTSRVGLVAHLMAGEVPPELEDAFTSAAVPLFPHAWKDLSSYCSCPDFANPCKHIAAVLYIFADRLDEDPWLLLQWRGRSREETLAAVGIGGAGDASDQLPPWWPLRPGDPLPERAGMVAPAVAAPPDPADAVLARLDDVPLQAWKAPVRESLAPLYEIAVDQTT